MVTQQTNWNINWVSNCFACRIILTHYGNIHFAGSSCIKWTVLNIIAIIWFTWAHADALSQSGQDSSDQCSNNKCDNKCGYRYYTDSNFCSRKRLIIWFTVWKKLYISLKFKKSLLINFIPVNSLCEITFIMPVKFVSINDCRVWLKLLVWPWYCVVKNFRGLRISWFLNTHKMISTTHSYM